MTQIHSLSPKLDMLMESAVRNGSIPGAVLLVSVEGEIRHFNAYGFAQIHPTPHPMRSSTILDLASITKVVASAALMHLVEKGKVDVQDKISRYISLTKAHALRDISIEALLLHASGLPAWRPLFQQAYEGLKIPTGQAATAEVRAKMFQLAQGVAPEYPPYEKMIYSDIGFILLTQIIEQLTNERLDAYCARELFSPIGLKNMFFNPVNPNLQRWDLDHFAATEWREPFHRYLVGEVHDENAHAMQGVSGHSGVFSTADDLHQFSLALLKAYHGERGLTLSSEVVRHFWQPYTFKDGTRRALGWDMPSAEKSSAGHYFSPMSVGHLGFTGTSLWIDVVKSIIVVLLTNRVHPSRTNEEIKRLRPKVHDEIMEIILSRSIVSTP